MSNDSSIKKRHGRLLEDLRDLLDSTVLRPLHKTVVSKANNLILDQALQIEALHAQLASYRAVAAVSPEEMHLWDSQPDMLMLVGYRKVPQMPGEFKTLYVKD